MTTGKKIWKVCRPEVVVLSFACAWYMATLCEAPAELRFFAALTSGLSCLGCSVFHFGAAHPVYRRKRERIDIQSPWTLIGVGAILLLASILLAWTKLNALAIYMSLFNAGAISIYATVLSKRWFTKNFTTIAIIATSPLTGWVVGTTTNPAAIYITSMVVLVYLAREILKDIDDIQANHGIRVTIPIRFGVPGATKIAGVVTAVGAMVCFTLYLNFSMWSAPISSTIFAIVAGFLGASDKPGQSYKALTFGSAVLILSFL